MEVLELLFDLEELKDKDEWLEVSSLLDGGGGVFFLFLLICQFLLPHLSEQPCLTQLEQKLMGETERRRDSDLRF